jgi:hypothetical protein
MPLRARIHASAPICRGNPAAVCPVAGWLDDGALRMVADENNLSEMPFSAPAAIMMAFWFRPCKHHLVDQALALQEFVGDIFHVAMLAIEGVVQLLHLLIGNSVA